MLATPSGRVDSVPEDVLLDFWPVNGVALEVTRVFVDSDTKVNKRFDDHVRDDVRREAPDERGFIDVTELAETLTDERRRASLLVLRSDTDDGSIVPENAVKFSEEEEKKLRRPFEMAGVRVGQLEAGSAADIKVCKDGKLNALFVGGKAVMVDGELLSNKKISDSEAFIKDMWQKRA